MIRVGGYVDYHAMSSIHSASFERGWSAEEIRELMDQVGAKAFVYEDGDKQAGFAMLRCAADECEILAIAVAADYQRQGIAQQLLDKSLEHALREDVTTIFLEVAEDNLAAIALYEAAGYKERGRRKGYYRRWHGRRVDALMLARSTTV